MKDTYKAVEVYEPGKLRVVERQVSEPGAGQVRIRVEACGSVTPMRPRSWAVTPA
jgi:NADPH:quinone reductase-like Zn-dependent oxidoreductase